jgi:hypothetical protein
MGIMHLVPSHVVIPIAQKGGSCIDQRINAAIASVLLSWRSCNAGNGNGADNMFLRLYLPLAFTSNIGQVGAFSQVGALNQTKRRRVQELSYPYLQLIDNGKQPLNERVHVDNTSATVDVGNECRVPVCRILHTERSPKIDGQLGDEMTSITSNYRNCTFLHDGKGVGKTIKSQLHRSERCCVITILVQTSLNFLVAVY